MQDNIVAMKWVQGSHTLKTHGSLTETPACQHSKLRMQKNTFKWKPFGTSENHGEKMTSSLGLQIQVSSHRVVFIFFNSSSYWRRGRGSIHVYSANVVSFTRYLCILKQNTSSGRKARVQLDRDSIFPYHRKKYNRGVRDSTINASAALGVRFGSLNNYRVKIEKKKRRKRSHNIYVFNIISCERMFTRCPPATAWSSPDLNDR